MRRAAAIAMLCAGLAVAAAEPGEPLRTRAERGDIPAQLELAMRSLYGAAGAKRNPVLAFYWYRRAAGAGSPEGQYNLGRCYEFGTGTPKDLHAAFRCYEKSAAAGIAPARFRLSELLRGGVPPATVEGVYRPGIAADPGRALTLLNALVLEKYPPALFLAAEQLLRGAAPGNANAERAVALLCVAADAGDPRAMRLLADCYSRGIGTPVNHGEMVKYLRLSAEQGDAESLALLGYAFEYGLGVAPDPDKAFQCFSEAAKSGVPVALVRMAEYHLLGMYVETDPRRAAALFRRAAAANSPQGAYRLGECYTSGIGVEKDPKAAFECFLAASALNEARAQYRLAECFRDGFGTPKDPGAVAYWLKRAAANGHPEAQEKLKNTAPAETPSGKKILETELPAKKES